MEKRVYLKSQLANIDPMVPILTENGKVANNPGNRLKYLRLQLIRMQANLSDKHPDIIKLKSEIKELEGQVGDAGSSIEKINRLKYVEKEIVELESRYGDKHPDVVRLTKEADLLKKQIAQMKSSAAANTVPDELTDNPGYMNIRAQIIVAESEINGLKEERRNLMEKLEDYQQRLEKAPFIDEEYNKLTLDYENARRKFNEASNKLHNARIAQQMDVSDQGQRFHIDSKAFLPDKPYKPKRFIIVLLGFLVALGAAVGVTALKEGMDTSIKAADDLENLLGVPVLAAVSFVDSPAQKRMRRSRRLMVLGTVLVTIIVTSFAINWFVMPIGDLWAKVENRLVEIGLPLDKKS